jgi:hypothetical protein
VVSAGDSIPEGDLVADADGDCRRLELVVARRVDRLIGRERGDDRGPGAGGEYRDEHRWSHERPMMTAVAAGYQV